MFWKESQAPISGLFGCEHNLHKFLLGLYLPVQMPPIGCANPLGHLWSHFPIPGWISIHLKKNRLWNFFLGKNGTKQFMLWSVKDLDFLWFNSNILKYSQNKLYGGDLQRNVKSKESRRRVEIRLEHLDIRKPMLMAANVSVVGVKATIPIISTLTVQTWAEYLYLVSYDSLMQKSV